MSTEDVSIVLLGAGYTLKRVADLLVKESLVLTCSSEESFLALQNEGYLVERLNTASPSEVSAFFARYSNLKTVVDSVPPQKDFTSCVAEALASSSNTLSRIIYLSTTGVYGTEDGSIVTENMPLNPLHERAKLRVLVENSYRALTIPSCSFRIAAIYGPGRGIGHALKAGRYPLIENGSRWSNRVHVDDLAAAVVAAIIHQGILPCAINLADDSPTLSSEIVEYYCKKFGFATPTSLSLNEARQRGLDTMLSNQRISNDLLKKFLLPKLRYPSFREGAQSEFE
jgi:dTDP-4-dehydrorhamnose reductase